MIRRFFSFVLIAAVITSCGNAGKKEATTNTDGIDNGVKVEFAALVENPDNYVGKTITVEGKVVHVCTESGKKLFIVGDNPDITLFIAAGEEMPKFPMELLGTTVAVEGVIALKGTAPKPAGTENMIMAEGTKLPGADSCVTEKALAAQVSLANVVMEYRGHVVK